LEEKNLTRRQFLHKAAYGMATLSIAPRGVASGFSTQRPLKTNIIFILTDDQRWDALGCAGNPIIQTPNMDQLAANGVRFENAFVTSPICTASRASILTGLHERTHGFTFQTPPLARTYTDMSYPCRLRQAGYRTGFIGKFGVEVEKEAIGKMFDFYVPRVRAPYFKKVDGKLRHLTEINGDEAIRFLRTCKPGQPFCISISFNAPHAEDQDPKQYFWPPACDNLYNDINIPGPKTSDPAFFNVQPEFLKESLNRVRWKWRFDTPQKYQNMVKGYYRMISGVDMVLGRITEELKRLGMNKNTIIILMGDNGYFLGERGFAGKWLMHEPSIHVPLIIYDPRRGNSKQGIVLKQMALNVDIAPTILSLAGLDIPGTMQGRALTPFLNGEHIPWRTQMFCEHLFNHPKIPQSEGIRTAHWKYIRYRQYPNFEELYDLVCDPREEHNLAGDKRYAAKLLELRKSCNEKIEMFSKKL